MNKAIPYVCSGTGLVMICNINSALCYFTGAFLMLFACLIWIKRLEQPQDQSRKTINHA